MDERSRAMSGGPQYLARTTRLALAHEIADRALAWQGERLLAIGLYGSLARGADGPYSDIEILCILSTSGEDFSHEWAYGAWKAEVNFLSQDIALHSAAQLEGDWPRTHGAYVHILPWHDPSGFFTKLKETVLSHPEECFQQAIHDLIVGEIYELIGKLRNAVYDQYTAALPYLAMNLAERGALLVGLANRHLYTSGARLLEESHDLPGSPSGYSTLCQQVMTGNLASPQRVVEVCEAFWAGLEAWAHEQGVTIDEPRKIPF